MKRLRTSLYDGAPVSTAPLPSTARAKAPRFDDAPPARCGAVVGEGAHHQVVTCSAAIGEGLSCFVCCAAEARGGAAQALRCGGHCLSAAHYGLPLISRTAGGWRGDGRMEVLYGEERPHGGLFYAELVDFAGPRPEVVALARSGLARGSGVTSEEARSELRARMAEEFGDAEPTDPLENPCDVPEAEPMAAVDCGDPATWEGFTPEQVAATLGVPSAGDSRVFSAYLSRVRDVVKNHLDDWRLRWDDLEETYEMHGDPRSLRAAELCALIAAIGGVR